MNSYYSVEELKRIGLKSIGSNVKISRKASIYGADHIVLGNNVRIDDFCILSGHIELGNYIHIAAYTALYGGDAGIYISDFVNISSRICIYSVSDDYSGESMTSPLIPDKYKNVKSQPVYIEKHVIIGTTSVVLPGVILKEGSSFGSYSLINHDAEEWTIYAGIPAKKLKARKKDLLKLEEKFILEQTSKYID